MNLLTSTDCYKMGHMLQYPEGTDEVYSVLTARFLGKYSQTYQALQQRPELGDIIQYQKVLVFGFQYYLNMLEAGITKENMEEFIECYKVFLDDDVPQEVLDKLQSLVDLGYLPIEIKALPEDHFVEYGTPIATVRNTEKGFGWVVGLIECLLLKMWYPISVSTLSQNYKEIAYYFANKSSDNVGAYLSYCIHDFGYRGCSSEETAEIGGMCHLNVFPASDTVKGYLALKKYYPEIANNISKKLSVPATEHSVACSYGLDNEEVYYKEMLKRYPEGILSLVSDTYDIYHVCENILPSLKEDILSRQGSTVIRPDSGDQLEVLLGERGIIQTLANNFGYYTNSKGYKVLNDKVRVIWGDGFNLVKYYDVLKALTYKGWAVDNLIVGVGALLLNLHNRDDHGFAFKATSVTINGEQQDIMKNPKTDSSKKSLKGKVSVITVEDSWITVPGADHKNDVLRVVYRDGVNLSK